MRISKSCKFTCARTDFTDSRFQIRSGLIPSGAGVLGIFQTGPPTRQLGPPLLFRLAKPETREQYRQAAAARADPHTHTLRIQSNRPSDLCGNLRKFSIFPWSVPFTVPGAPGASCARRGVPGRPRAPLGLSKIYSVPQAINASRGFARCEGVSQIRVGRVKIKRMSLKCPPYSFHRQPECKSERQPYPPLLCVHFRGPPGHHRRVLRVDTRKTLHLYGLGC